MYVRYSIGCIIPMWPFLLHDCYWVLSAVYPLSSPCCWWVYVLPSSLASIRHWLMFHSCLAKCKWVHASVAIVCSYWIWLVNCSAPLLISWSSLWLCWLSASWSQQCAPLLLFWSLEQGAAIQRRQPHHHIVHPHSLKLSLSVVVIVQPLMTNHHPRVESK